eukprot:scaffold1580_cov162-Pinguiococcus_pyrenoidosus.AAC.3
MTIPMLRPELSAPVANWLELRDRSRQRHAGWRQIFPFAAELPEDHTDAEAVAFEGIGDWTTFIAFRLLDFPLHSLARPKSQNLTWKACSALEGMKSRRFSGFISR